MKSKYPFNLFIAGFFCVFSFSVIAEDSSMYIPVAGYDYLNIESVTIHTPGIGLILVDDSFAVSGIYKHGFLSEENQSYPLSGFHSVDLMMEVHKDGHQLITSFISESDQPVYGGWATLQAAVIYNYRLINTDVFKLHVGAGAALGDFGIDLADGSNWPLVPILFLSLEYTASGFKAEFSFISGPDLDIVLFPENNFRIYGQLQINSYKDLRDLLFDLSLCYRLFAENESVEDFIGISAGINNNVLDFVPGGDDEEYELQYYSLYTKIDLSIIKISGGYNFNGRRLFGNEISYLEDSGFFLGLEGAYRF
ncbi:MAG: hypothetical protein PQJ61_04695 [Spirochaetales bacterium]|uniref:Uncharacterized protein n=1 Tax=Candidatus Thalassospirochaeta sargassi TaxID=3119039 RepID=A0AAJ1IET4_9SPIO|nr:hypothetical protein [Spirochaetales bacterium]